MLMRPCYGSRGVISPSIQKRSPTMTDKTHLKGACDFITNLGYAQVRGELNFYGGTHYARDSISVSYRDLLDEHHSVYVSRNDGESDYDWRKRIEAKLEAIPAANDALEADAAAMVAKLRQKLIDAGFEKETWMGELASIVEKLSQNTLTAR